MTPGLVHLFFIVSGACLMAHILLSQLLRILVKWNSPLAMELFAIPRTAFSSSSAARLFKLKYFLPWVAAPATMAEQSSFVHSIFWLTRIAGLLFPMFMVAFFISLAIVATP